MSESTLLRAVLQALAAKRVFAWRVNAGVTVLGKGRDRRVIRGAPAGSPDIMGIVPGSDGRLFGLELKAPGGRLRATQQRWSEKATAHGIRYGVARSVSEAIGLVEGWR